MPQEEEIPEAEAAKGGEQVKKGYVGIHSSGFKDFLLKPELLRAIQDCGFEHPSEGAGAVGAGGEGAAAGAPLPARPGIASCSAPLCCPSPAAVQHECIPQAILGQDVICQAKSGMGKTAVFVISTLQQLEPVDGQVSVLVLCHTRELAFQITHEFERFSTYLKSVRVANFFGGLPIKQVGAARTAWVLHVGGWCCAHVIAAARGRWEATGHRALGWCRRVVGDVMGAGWVAPTCAVGAANAGANVVGAACGPTWRAAVGPCSALAPATCCLSVPAGGHAREIAAGGSLLSPVCDLTGL